MDTTAISPFGDHVCPPETPTEASPATLRSWFVSAISSASEPCRKHLLNEVIANVPLSDVKLLAAKMLVLSNSREIGVSLPEKFRESVQALRNSASTALIQEKMDLHKERLQFVIDKYVKAGWPHYLLKPCCSGSQAHTMTYSDIVTAWRQFVDTHKTEGFTCCENFRARATQVLEKVGFRKMVESDKEDAAQEDFSAAETFLQRERDACVDKLIEIEIATIEAADILEDNILYNKDDTPSLKFSALLKEVGDPLHDLASRYQGRLEQAQELSRQINAWLEEGSAHIAAVNDAIDAMENLRIAVKLARSESITMDSVNYLFMRGHGQQPPSLSLEIARCRGGVYSISCM